MAAAATTNRIASLDVIRGFAILGILLANLPAFSQPVMWEFTGKPDFGAANGWAEAVRDWLVAGKFRGMLCVLFGVGMSLQAAKRITWPGSYLKRTLLLGVIGAIHGFLIWYGDILLMYALTALICMFLAKKSDKLILTIAGICLGISFLMGAGIAAVSVAFGGAAMGGGGQESMFGLSAAQEIAAYQGRNPLDHLAWRSGTYAFAFFMQAGMVLPSLLGQFLIGVWLGRRGFFARPSQHPKTLKLLVGVGLFGGLLLNALPLAAMAFGFSPEVSNFNEMFGGAVLALGYAGALAWMVEKLRSPIFTMFSWVGRAALSCYLLTSVLCTFLFYGFGLGWFGQVSYLQSLVVVPGVYAVVILFAWAWLRMFKMGPVEGVWRRMSEKGAKPEAPMAPPAPPTPAPASAPPPMPGAGTPPSAPE